MRCCRGWNVPACARSAEARLRRKCLRWPSRPADFDCRLFNVFVGLAQAAPTYPRSKNLAYNRAALFNRGRRRSRRSKAEQGAAPDNVAAMERREAQGSSQGPARPGTPTPSRLGSRNLGAMTPASQAGEGSLASSLAPPGAPSPRSEGDGKGKRRTRRR